MISILEILLMLIAVVAIVHIWFWLMDWYLSMNKTDLFIKYKDFKKSYDTNPHHWTVYDNNVCFHKSGYDESGFYTQSFIFHFYPIGYYKYKLWHNSLEKRARKIKQKAARQEIISIIKSESQKGDKNETSI